MRYLITTKDTKPFLTHWFQSENNFNIDLDMVVYDLVENKYTDDGETWNDIDIDHL